MLPEISIAERTAPKEKASISINLPTMIDVPLRGLFIAYNATKFNPATKVLITPKSIKNGFLSFLERLLPNTAACAAPIPGRKEQAGPEIIPPFSASKISLLSIFCDFNSCSGTEVFL